MEEKSPERAKRYRERAEEIRTAASQVTHSESREALLRLAHSYERLANKIDLENENLTGSAESN